MAGMHIVGPFIIAESILLVALALGYIVCYFANQEEKQIKAIGLVIGTFIITLSVVLILGNLVLAFNQPRNKYPSSRRMMLKNNPMPIPELPLDFDLDEMPFPDVPSKK